MLAAIIKHAADDGKDEYTWQPADGWITIAKCQSMPRLTDIPAVRPEAWGLDPAVAMLNHGSFGACPRPVLETQQRLRAELERQPVLFFERRMQPLLDESRAALCRRHRGRSAATWSSSTTPPPA